MNLQISFASIYLLKSACGILEMNVLYDLANMFFMVPLYFEYIYIYICGQKLCGSIDINFVYENIYQISDFHHFGFGTAYFMNNARDSIYVKLFHEMFI